MKENMFGKRERHRVRI